MVVECTNCHVPTGGQPEHYHCSTCGFCSLEAENAAIKANLEETEKERDRLASEIRSLGFIGERIERQRDAALAYAEALREALESLRLPMDRNWEHPLCSPAFTFTVPVEGLRQVKAALALTPPEAYQRQRERAAVLERVVEVVRQLHSVDCDRPIPHHVAPYELAVMGAFKALDALERGSK